MSKKNNQFITGLVVGAAVTYLLTRPKTSGGGGGVLVIPKTDKDQAPKTIGQRQMPYNPFHYLPGDLGRQLPAIYAL